MKKILLLILSILGIHLNAQVSYNLVANSSDVGFDVSETNVEFVQKVLSKKPIHIHPDSISKGFTICWNGPETSFKILGPDNKIKREGIISNNVYISTKRWKGGRYILKINDEIEIIMLMRK